MVPAASFTSYYGRPVVKASPWSSDIPAYVFLGGLASCSSLLATGADLTTRPALGRASRLSGLVAISASAVALVHDLGRPARFHHMLRVAKLTSPMNVGSWLLLAYGPMAGLAGISEAAPHLPKALRTGRLGARLPLAGRAAGFAAAGVAPLIATYTAVLLSDTATPSWHEARRDLPFVFASSSAAAAGGMGMLTTPLRQAGPARAMGAAGAVLDLVTSRTMESAMGITAEPLHNGRPGAYIRAARLLTSGGALLAVTLGRRSRPAAAVAGAALVAGSFCTKFGIFHAGQQSAGDPTYTVTPQRERLEQAQAARG